MKTSNIIAFGYALTMLAASPASATEIISVDFTKPDGGVSTNLYSGIVDVVVSGTGFAAANNINDAFYLIQNSIPAVHSRFFQLAFSTLPLLGNTPSTEAKYSLVGGIPAYSPDNTYSFQLDTGTTVPTQLHFGVSDDVFYDNGGSFKVTITSPPAVPEPATWAMLLVGIGCVGYAMRRRPAQQQTVTFAS